MPKPAMTIIVTTGTVRTSWCDGCLTSSRYEVECYAILDSGAVPMGTAHGCERCDPDVIKDDVIKDD